MVSRKVRNPKLASFRRMLESSHFNSYWMPPDQVRGRLIKSGMTSLGLFARLSHLDGIVLTIFSIFFMQHWGLLRFPFF